MRRCLAGVLLAMTCLTLARMEARAQTTRVADSTLALPPLADYVGVYDDAPGHMLEIIAADDLFAVIDDAKYRLRRAGRDVFTNAPGDTIPFRRDARGAVTGYVERGVFHRRRSSRVSSASAALARAEAGRAPSPTGYSYVPPADRHDGIAVGNIADTPLGVETAQRIVRGVLDGTWNDVHGVLLYQRGHLVLEEYFYGYDAERPHQMRSATKSVVGALVGAAVDRGALRGVDEPVLARLAYDAYDNPDPRKARITLGDLLTMRAGLACDDHDGRSPGRETVIDETPDWVKATLDLPMVAEPGSVARYCSGGVAVAGRVTERAVRTTLPDFAQAALFGPMGVRRTDWSWNFTLTNANREFAQIHLRPREMLKLGLLYADSGRWKGRQVLSARWVAASLAAQTQLEGTGYGYFWWRPWLRVAMPDGEERVYMNAAQGNGGQKIYLVPQYDLVAVFTGGDYNSGGSPPNKIMSTVILPKLIAASRGANTAAPR
ncbi:MAG: beta-lactamase [Gemmatimonadetes bacterium]|nr:beta-lactamase [Gemmatimonadota bacterium]